MRDRKTKEKKHESTIGKIIYGFLLFLPLIAISVASLVSTFNMSAKEETEITYKYQTNEVNSKNDLIVGNTYLLNIPIKITNNENNYSEYELFEQQDYGSNIFKFVNYDTNLIEYNFVNFSDFIDFGVINIGQFKIGQESTSLFSFDSDIDANAELTFNTSTNPLGDYYVKLFLTYLNNEDNINNDLITNNYFSSLPIELNPVENVETHNLGTQEVFYRAIDKVQQSPLFNWAENSVIYTGISNFTTSLSITTPFIPLLMTYWLIISIVYFLYDIVLIILVVLHKKIHYIEESI